MRRYFFILPVLAFASCTISNTETEITGHIDHGRRKFVTLQETNNNFSSDVFDTLKVDSAGNFRKTLHLSQATSFALGNLNVSVAFEAFPGKPVTISIDEANQSNLQFAKEDLVNTTMANFSKGIYKGYELYSRDRAKIMAFQDSLCNVFIKELDQMKSQLSKQEYKKLNGFFNDQQFLISFFGTTDSLKQQQALEKININENNLSTYHIIAVNTKLDALFRKSSIHADDNMAHFKFVGNAFHDSQMRDYYQTSFLFFNMLNNNSANISTCDSMLSILKQNKINPSYINEVEKKMAGFKMLQPGNIANDFSGIDSQGKEIKLSDLKGKIVVIDVWATWCPPCRNEKLYFMKLAEKLKNNKGIIFLCVSVDKSVDDWKKFISSELHSQNVMQINSYGENSQNILKKDYKVMGIPTFMLIDKEGKFILRDAPSPSSGELEKILEKAI